METVYDLIEEAKVRTVCWAICVFAISYFLSHTSKSMWTNVPISLLILSAFRYLSYQVELRWRVRPIQKQTYLSHLVKKQLSVNDSRLSTVRTTSKWRRKIDSPLVEAAINEFTDKILQDFVIDLWYSSITPDKEAPELIRMLILDALGEISGRIKEINLIDLLTRDMVDLIGNHLDLYRKNQSEIGVDVMGTLSFEERDERLKRHLMASKELHPALISQECEYKVLQRIVGGIIATVLNPREAQSPLVRCFSRELLTSLVVQPLMNFASPAYINELIEQILLSSKDNKGDNVGSDRSNSATTSTVSKHSVSMDNLHSGEPDHKRSSTSNQSIDLTLVKSGGASLSTSGLNHPDALGEDSTHCTQARSAEWAMVLEAATKRRSQVLAPENLENMWTKGRNYQKKSASLATAGTSSTSINKSSGTLNSSTFGGTTGQEMLISINEKTARIEAKPTVNLICGTNDNTQSSIATNTETHSSQDLLGGQSILEGHFGDGSETNASKPEKSSNEQLCQSSSTPDIDSTGTGKTDKTLYSQKFYSSNLNNYKEEPSAELVPRHEESLTLPKIKCRVVGAYFEKLGSKSFAVYSIAVTDAESKTWFVKRRYRNFELLHRHLKDIPNYSLHLPPKRFLSSSIDDYFVHQRCILLDKYLQDLLSIANIAEQHEVWDFLSSSSKNYSFGKSTSVMKTLAVNVDDAMDDIVRQFKGVSDGLRRKVVGPSTSYAISPPITERMLALPWNEEASKHSPSHSNMETSHSLSDDEVHAEEDSSKLINGWHSDNELHSKGFPPRIVKRNEESVSVGSQRGQQSDTFDINAFDKHLSTKTSVASDLLGDFSGVPPEWTPANVSVPLLNLVDKTFQLNRRGWLRRQVFWISKQILQLMMEDAIDDWILMQINWLRSEVVIAQGIRWVQDILWPDGTFFIQLGSGQGKSDDTRSNQKPSHVSRRASCDKSSFELQLEAARRASDIKKMIVGGAPTALVSLIGHKQYHRSAKDIYYFLQSTICLKQLAYCMLELVLVSVFPELRDLFLDIHEKMQSKQE